MVLRKKTGSHMANWAINRKAGSVNLIDWNIKNRESLMPALDYLVLLWIVAISRWVYRSHSLYHMDSIDYALGMEYFSPTVHQPHPPGSYLYVKLAQLVHNVLPNSNDTLVAISIVASCAAAALTYRFAHVWFGRAAARWSGILFVLSPLIWFHGTVAMIYIVEAAVSALFAYLCWLTWCGRHAMLIPAVIVLGLTVGIRQSAVLFLAPLLLLVLWKVGWRQALVAIVVGTLTVGAWFIPMLIESGGYVVYFTALNDLLSRVAEPFLYRNILNHGALLLLTYALCFGVAAPLLFVRNLPIQTPSGGWMFIIIWLTPGLLFFLYTFGPMTLGHALFLCVPLAAILGAKIAALPIVKKGGRGRLFLIMTLIAIHIMLFLYVPRYISQSSIAQHAHDIEQIEQAIRTIAKSEGSLVIGADAHFYGYRHLGYALPEYQVLSFPECRFSQGMGVFSMQNRRSKILSRIPIEQYKEFVFYFPGSKDIKIYQELFPQLRSESIKTITINGHAFLIGPTSALRQVFQNTAR